MSSTGTCSIHPDGCPVSRRDKPHPALPPHKDSAAMCEFCGWAWVGSEWLAAQLREVVAAVRADAGDVQRPVLAGLLAKLDQLVARGERS